MEDAVTLPYVPKPKPAFVQPIPLAKRMEMVSGDNATILAELKEIKEMVTMLLNKPATVINTTPTDIPMPLPNKG